MGIFSKFENRMEDTFEGAAGKMSKAPISPVQIAKKAEKQMKRETMVGAGREYAPTLYTVLVNPDDDARLFGYYPTLAGETETYLSAKAMQQGLVMDGEPLVRFIVDSGLRHGKFDVIAELVAAPIIEQLREEEMERYGLSQKPRQGGARQQQAGYAQQQAGYAQQQGGYDQPQGGYAQPQAEYGYAQQQAPQRQAANQPHQKPPLPYVPEDEIDRSIDYGEYTFNSEDFEDYRDGADNGYAPAYNDAPAQPAVQQANTVTFAGGGAAQAAPDHKAVRARLVDTAYQRTYDLAGSHITLGRETGNDIVVQDMNASRRHAELRLNAQGIWVVTDLGSMNGTLVNGISIASQPLYPGDTITIGKTDFEFLI